MGIEDSANISVLFEDIDLPLFTQRETSDLCSGSANMKAISNWLDRGLIELEPLNGRPQSGRRLFSRRQVIVLDIVGELVFQGLSPQDAFTIAGNAMQQAVWSHKANELVYRPEGSSETLFLWLIISRAMSSGRISDGFPWEESVAFSPKNLMTFHDFHGNPINFDKFNHRPSRILIPLGEMMQGLAHQVSEVLASDIEKASE